MELLGQAVIQLFEAEFKTRQIEAVMHWEDNNSTYCSAAAPASMLGAAPAELIGVHPLGFNSRRHRFPGP